jgi:hypothetical protein
MWSKDWRGSVKPVALFTVGFFLVGLWLAYYNYSRFGNILETGRTVDIYDNLTFGYGRLVSPWTGLYGLLISPGKGLLLFCPAVILGFVSWRHFHRAHPVLSYALAGAAVFRIVFISCRSDWHGGFCLGPRFLLMLIPFLLIPFGYLLQDMLRRNNRIAGATVFVSLLVCVSQQLYFSIGEMCSYYHLLKWKIDSLDVGRLYLTWGNSPLFRLLEFRRGPFLLREVPVSNLSLWLIATAALAVLLGIGCYFSFATGQESK